VPGGESSVTITYRDSSTTPIASTTLNPSLTWYGKLEIHLPYDGTAEDDTYIFTITVNGYQYNAP
jgi:hypothetical protein